MFRPLAFYIGLRYTRAKRQNSFISFISFLSIAGMILGVTILIIVMSVMNGFDRELRQRILGMVPHATITAANGTISNWQYIQQQVNKTEGIIASAPFIKSQALAVSDGVVQGVMINGINSQLEKNVSIINKHIIEGKLTSLTQDSFNVIIGSLLAKKLGLSIGDKITFILPDASINLLGVFPKMKRFNVSGIFSVGANLDESMIYANIQDIAKFLSLPVNNAQGLRLKVDNLFDAPSISWNATMMLKKPYFVSDWTREYGQLFSAIHMEKMMVGLLLSFLIAIAAFNIISSLVMIVTDKRGDIAILRTFGAHPKTIMSIFIFQGTIIGLLGTIIGVTLGVIGAINISAIATWIQKTFHIQFLDPHVYFISYLPSQINWTDIAVISCGSILLSFLATIYPAWRAAKIQPAEALRYE